MVNIAGFNSFLPVFSFLLVFVVIFAVLAKTKILGENAFFHFLISFILASFFIVNTNAVEFVKINSAWFVVFFICIFFILLLVAFTHGKIDVIMKPSVAWILLGLLLIVFVVTSSYVFKWAINWGEVSSWLNSEWFGFGIFLVIAAIVSFIITKK